MSRKGQLTLNFNSKFRQILRDNFGTDDEKEIKEIIFKLLENGNTDFQTTKEKIAETELKLKQSKLENYGYKNRIDKVKAKQIEKYDETFDTAPTTDGLKAIEKFATRDPTEQEKQQVTKFITLRKDSQNPLLWNAKCDLCQDGDTYETHKEAIDDMIRHLTTEHKKQVMYVR